MDGYCAVGKIPGSEGCEGRNLGVELKGRRIKREQHLPGYQVEKQEHWVKESWERAKKKIK